MQVVNEPITVRAVETLLQVVTVALAVIAIIWHQQRTTDRLRDQITALGERLARIEGFLGIGMPDTASSQAARATRAAQQPPESEQADAD